MAGDSTDIRSPVGPDGREAGRAADRAVKTAGSWSLVITVILREGAKEAERGSHIGEQMIRETELDRMKEQRVEHHMDSGGA